MIFWIFMIGFAVLYGVNMVLGLHQAKHYTRAFTDLKRRGRVAIGKHKGLIGSGAIVMFLLDDADRVVEGKKICGVTVFSRFRAFDVLDGQPIAGAEPTRHLPKVLGKAVENAKANYAVAHSGGRPVDPPTAIGRTMSKFRRKKPVAA
ncbi:MAG: transcriptional regulator GutM [Propionibacteriaceae bacterium]|jgi:DNA-binding transcriptional regulator of glucitol operon|nr:transcriptional regulator GutM [Propionibacteriaceae bacterium]